MPPSRTLKSKAIKRGKKRAADDGDLRRLDLSTITCSLLGCSQLWWKTCDVCFEEVCRDHESDHDCQSAAAVDDAQPSSREPIKKYRSYLSHQHHIGIYLGKKVGYAEAANLIEVHKSLIPRWISKYDYHRPAHLSEPTLNSPPPMATQRHLPFASRPAVNPRECLALQALC